MKSVHVHDLVDKILAHASAASCDLAEQGEDRWRGPCPLCGKEDLTLTVKPSEDGLWLSCWHASCSTEAILQAFDLTWDDLRIQKEKKPATIISYSFSDMELEETRFLVPDRIPIGAGTLLAGDPFAGKSTFTAHIAAQVTKGVYGEPGQVILINAEDSPRKQTRARLEAAGADLELVKHIQVEQGAGEQLPTLPDHVDVLESWIASQDNVRLVILDPLVAFLSDSTESNRDHSVRRALTELQRVAERLDIALIVCMHLNKSEQQAAIYRVGGTIGFVGLMRSLLFLARDPEDPDGPRGNSRLLAHGGCNWGQLAPTLAYQIQGMELTAAGGKRVATTHMVYKGQSKLEIHDIIGSRKPKTRGAQAEDEILEVLADGPRLSREVKAEVMRKLDCGHATVERASRELKLQGVIRSSGSGAHTMWSLADEDDSPPQPPPQPPHTFEEEEEDAAHAHLLYKREARRNGPPPPQKVEEVEEVVEEVAHTNGSVPSNASERVFEALRRRGTRP